MKYNPKLAEIVNARPSTETPKAKEDKPIAREPETEYSFLGGDFGRNIHERIITKYSDIEAITKVEYDDTLKIVKGSNSFYVTAVNDELRSHGMRTATQADLEKALASGMSLTGTFEDTGLVWHSNRDPNSYLANKLFLEAKSKGINLNEGVPYVFPLCALSLKKDDNSPNELGFNINNPNMCFPAPILASESQKRFENTDIDETKGIPKEVRENGSRILFTRNWADYGPAKMQGVSRLYLYGGLYVYSDDEGLASSNDDGRVVVVRAVGTHGAKN